MSDTDIHAGQHWTTEVTAALQDAVFGILCITKEGADSKWLHYEAGVLARSGAAVVPLLIDMVPADLSGDPFGLFQAKQLNRQGCHDLVVALNAKHGNPLERSPLDRLFDRGWPTLAEALRIPREIGLEATIPLVPTDALRRAVTRATADMSLRRVARDAGVTPMGLQSFSRGQHTPQRRTLRKLSEWYVRSAYAGH